jgi:hypothetical protein
MGVIVNEAPELYNGVIAQVPFVDVMTTMLMIVFRLQQGNMMNGGNKKKYYNYMRSYSPYDNVKEQNYPNMYVSQDYMIRKCSTGSLQNGAKLRTMKKMILFCILTLIWMQVTEVHLDDLKRSKNWQKNLLLLDLESITK